jgi:BirA family biotin operon repressor/biotin-[acetyl-CoA-carboxylase] ligase
MAGSRPVVQWPAEAIWEAIAPVLPDFSVEVLPQVDSTNSELMRRARAARQEPVLLVAEHQSAGRGRLGRAWQSSHQHAQAGEPASLTFSLGLSLSPKEWSGLSLVAGLCAAEALDPDGRGRLGLKWPNDLWLEDRKLGGILIETAGAGAGSGEPRYVVIGMGLNVRPREIDGLSTAPAWLSELPQAPNATQALMAVAPVLVKTVLAFAELGFSPFAGRFAARDVLQGRSIRCSDGVQGVAGGVDSAGALLVHTQTGLQAIQSAEVSVRPAEPPA